VFYLGSVGCRRQDNLRRQPGTYFAAFPIESEIRSKIMTEKQEKQGVSRNSSSESPKNTAVATRDPDRTRQVGRPFDHLFERFLSFLDQGDLHGRGLTWGMEVDDQDKQVVVHAEAPGFDPDDFHVEVRDNELKICGCHESMPDKDGGNWAKREIYRTMTLPSGVDAEHVDAEYRNGMLTITVPKTEAGRARKVQVKGPGKS
jgi:HSP20 family protein